MATRWACLGPGKISFDFFKAIQENLPAADHEFVAVASRDLSRAQKFAERFKFKKAYGSYEEVASDTCVEIVYIGTLHTTHAELSMKMLEAGKHVLCEKPMAMNYKQAKQVLDFARSKKLLFVEGCYRKSSSADLLCVIKNLYQWQYELYGLYFPERTQYFIALIAAMWSRFFPIYNEIRKEITFGTLGDIKLVQASLCLPLSNVERIRDVNLGGGGALDIGIYVVQFACFVFNEMPESISAVGSLMEGGADENACIILKYKNGAIANLTYHCSVLNNNCAVICGTKGRIEVSHPFSCPTRMTSPSGVKEFPLKSEGYNFSFCNNAGLHYEARAIRECLLEGKLEHEFVTHTASEMVHKILDEVRKQIGVVYPEFD